MQDVTGYISRLSHENDWEIPASCSGLCDNGICPGQYDTANLNSYLYANKQWPRLDSCVCVRQRSSFVPDDGEYHTYAIEWHTGDTDDPEKGCAHTVTITLTANMCQPLMSFIYRPVVHGLFSGFGSAIRIGLVRA